MKWCARTSWAHRGRHRRPRKSGSRQAVGASSRVPSSLCPATEPSTYVRSLEYHHDVVTGDNMASARRERTTHVSSANNHHSRSAESPSETVPGDQGDLRSASPAAAGGDEQWGPEGPHSGCPTARGRRKAETLKCKHAELREPCLRAFAAYRISRLIGMTQVEIAKALVPDYRPVTQGQISRDIRCVKTWLARGNVAPEWLERRNVAPDLGTPPRKPIPIDPSVIERGPRLDGRVLHQRCHSSKQ
jgi:hypothetical protein